MEEKKITDWITNGLSLTPGQELEWYMHKNQKMLKK